MGFIVSILVVIAFWIKFGWFWGLLALISVLLEVIWSAIKIVLKQREKEEKEIGLD